MIEKIDDISQLNNYNIVDIYSVRILSLLNAYGCKYPFARFYRQVNNIGNITAILSVLDKDLTLSFDSKNADKEELIEFISVIGFATLLCDYSLHIDAPYDEGAVMKSYKKTELACEYNEVNRYHNLLDLYEFIGYEENNFESWYVDINHRIRHNSAKAVTIEIDKQIVSSAILSSIYKNDAIITGVRTDPNFRKKGYGSALVSSLCTDNIGDIYLMREKDKNESFYKKLGFKNIGKWRIYK